MTPRRLAVAVAAAYLPLAYSAFAEATLTEIKVTAQAEAEPATYQAEIATTATKIKAPLRDVPQTVNVVTQSLIEDQGARSLQDTLKNVPGVSFNNGDGQRDQFVIRGFNAMGDMFVDGMRDDALYYRDLSNTERVEVVKGPAAVLYGRGSSGGVINRISKKPGQSLREIELTAGSFDQKRAGFDIGDKLGDSASFRITGAKEDSGSFRDQGFLEREAIAPSMEFKLGADTKLLLQAEYLKDRRVTDMGIPAINGRPVDVPIETYYGSSNAREDDYSQSTVKSGRVTFDHKFNENWSLHNQFGSYSYELDRHNTNVASVSGSGSSAKANLSHGDDRRQDDGWFNQFELTQNAHTGAIKHQLLYGVEVGEQTKDFVRRTRSAGSVSLYNPTPELTRQPANTGAPGTSNLATMKVSSAYVQDLLTLSQQWKALLGLRYDEFDQRVQDRKAGVNLGRVDQEWSPRAGVVFQPADWQSYYLSYSHSFQPSGETLALATNNADLDPEETRNIEVGTKLDLLDGRASITAAVFELNRTNVKNTDPTTKKIIPVGEQRTRGLELTFAGEVAKGWQVSAGYAYLNALVTKSIAKTGAVPLQGTRVALTPKHSGNLWVMHALGNNFSVGGGINYASKRYVGTDNTTTLAGYATYDATVQYKVQAYDVALNLKNLSDKRYFVSGHDAVNNLNVPGAPRSAELTVRYRF